MLDNFLSIFESFPNLLLFSVTNNTWIDLAQLLSSLKEGKMKSSRHGTLSNQLATIVAYIQYKLFPWSKENIMQDFSAYIWNYLSFVFCLTTMIYNHECNTISFIFILFHWCLGNKYKAFNILCCLCIQFIECFEWCKNVDVKINKQISRYTINEMHWFDTDKAYRLDAK